MSKQTRVPGTVRERPSGPVRDRSQEGLVAEKMLLYQGALRPERWLIGRCTVMVAREPLLAGGGYIWHLSIAHPSRYPTWDEIKYACYGIPTVQGVTLAQVLSPVDDDSPWVDLHSNCFHLYEIDDPFARTA